MEWRDQGVVLSARKHGESAAIVEVFTAKHGLHLGMVRGGASRKMTPVLQPSMQIDVTWRARREDSLGNFAVEPIKSRSGVILSDKRALAGLNAITGLLRYTLAERVPCPTLYQRTLVVLDLLGCSSHWPLAYLRWELALLEEMGFGLDLSSCAATGGNDRLVYVSPKTGRAVSLSGAGEWADRLLSLPPCLLGEPPKDFAEVAIGMRTTGHFFEHKLGPALGNRPLPAARARLAELFSAGLAP